ncbi:MAG: hypothetical protein ACKVPZ_00415 [Burkholderiaceae bacterium]
MGLNLNTATTHILSGHQSDTQKSNQSAKRLFASLKSGDLAGAQKAFTQFSSTQGGKYLMQNLNSSFAQLGAALKSGNLKSAQSLASGLQGGQALASSLSSNTTSSGSSANASNASNASNAYKGSKPNPQAILNSIKAQTSMSLFGVLDGLDASERTGNDTLSGLTGLGKNINTLA